MRGLWHPTPPARDSVKLFHPFRATKQSAVRMKSFSLAREGSLKQSPAIVTPVNQRGVFMWWGLLVSLVFAYPAIEMVEEWRIHRSAKKDLAEMRKHTASDHRWDVTRGQWVG